MQFARLNDVTMHHQVIGAGRFRTAAGKRGRHGFHDIGDAGVLGVGDKINHHGS